MRYRERYDTTSADTFDLQTFCYKPAFPGTFTTVSYTDSLTYDVMCDENHPLFKQRSAEGEIIFGDMLQEEIHGTIVKPIYAEFQWDATYDDNLTFRNGKHFGLNDQLSDILKVTPHYRLDDAYWDSWYDQFSSERAVAVTQAWANVDESEMLAWASIGEMPETLAWLASLYRRGIGVLALTKVRKLRLAKKRLAGMSAVEYADALANFWLEFRYAMRPLVFEMEQLVEALQNKTKPPRRTARGYHDVEQEDSLETTIDLGNNYSVDRSGTLRRESTYRAGVLYNISTLHDNWMEILGLDKPLESIYELTKMSFVLDWFFNVGDLLSSYTTSANLTPLVSWVTEEHLWTHHSFYSGMIQDTSGNPDYDCVIRTPCDGEVYFTHRVKVRKQEPDKPVLPHIKINLDWAKVVDLAAIARSIYRAFK